MTTWPYRSAPASSGNSAETGTRMSAAPARRLGFVTVTRSEAEAEPEWSAI